MLKAIRLYNRKYDIDNPKYFEELINLNRYRQLL